ncbi:MAG: LacI family DNA-binding transcriptional regulator [Clostridium sp.]|nr:LacI family DNA-binding transcriptional regulator [Clostridium sp.]
MINIKKVTFSDIAKYTNFSKTTISRYFNAPETLTKESIKKIEKALIDLDYKENKVAKSLANGRTEIIGIIVPNLYLHYYSNLLNCLLNTYPKYNYKFLVFTGNSNPDEEMNYIQELLSYKIEGLILLSNSINSKTLSNLDIPIVGIEREDKYISSINSDNYSGALKATNMLIDNNCDILIHINNDVSKDMPSYKRIEAFKDACENRNANYKLYLSDKGSSFKSSYEDLYNIYQQIEKDYPKIKKGIFVSNDTHANILLNILVRNKKNIPEEYEIIGFDNSPISTEAIIPITTVGQDVVRIANESIKLILRQINLKKKKQSLEIQHITIDTNFFIRETTS